MEHRRSIFKNRIALNEVLPISLPQFAKLFCEDGAEHSQQRFHESLRDKQCQTYPWAPLQDNPWACCYHREFHFVKAVTNPLAGIDPTPLGRAYDIIPF